MVRRNSNHHFFMSEITLEDLERASGIWNLFTEEVRLIILRKACAFQGFVDDGREICPDCIMRSKRDWEELQIEDRAFVAKAIKRQKNGS